MTNTKKPTTVAKQIRSFLDACAARENYRAVPWVFEKGDIAMLCRYSQRLMSGDVIELNEQQNETMHILTHGLDHGFIVLTSEHENQGLAYLWSQWNRQWLGSKELRIMKRFSHFSFAGISTELSGMHYVSAPIYRVHGDDGTFTYEAWSWQSGRKPVLV